MHPLTRFFNYLKRIDFSMALEREHIDERALTDWYPQWMYELMETDEVRTSAYEGAIREAVAGKTVLELGTGRRAILAGFCARAGAGKVYAVEANRQAYEASCAFVKAQGIANIELIHGFSDRIELPERCEVLVHDLVGDIGSSEGMALFVDDARRRLLTLDAVHIPNRCVTHAVLAEDPRLTPAETALSWLLREGKGFEQLTFVRYFGFPPAAALSAPLAFEDLRLGQAPELATERTLAFEITRDGRLRGVLLSIRLELGPGHVIDTWKSQTSWSTPYIRLQAAAEVKAGDRVEMQVRSDLSGNPRYEIALTLLEGAGRRSLGGYQWSGD